MSHSAEKSTGKSAESFTFFENVYDIVRLIPHGKVTSYGAIAKYLGAPSAARMVGWAMNSSHALVPPIPAHRVLNRSGLLTGKYHFGSEERMKELLQAEGIPIENNQVVDFQRYFWDPSLELNL